VSQVLESLILSSWTGGIRRTNGKLFTRLFGRLQRFRRWGRKRVEVKRLAAVFARDGDFLVEPNCQTTTGLWLSADPVVLLPRSTSAAELGAAVLTALTRCQ
jgi:hypothetical protein